MAFSSGGGGDNSVMADINTTPLVDVMLVLLIIFMITAPLMASKIPVTLPQAANEPESQDDEGAKITLSVQALPGGQVQYFWDESPVTLETLEERIRNEATKGRAQPKLKIRADKNVNYKAIADVMKIAKGQGFMRVSFITAPGEQ
jgi:biopolymer transport protein ExbD